ncbi:MAG: EamA family transporter RarD [Pseudomonadota bacterium]|jgi:chloramphenicol-sensitive protein RarD
MTGGQLRAAGNSGPMYAIAAYATWGFVPLYWRELRHIPPLQILAHRIVWSIFFFTVLFFLRRNLTQWLSFARQADTLKKSLPSAIAIGINWGLYIYAVNSGHALESSLGYFINPIFNVLIGAVFFKETLTRAQWTAFAFAASGVAVMTFAAGKVPWIALSLAGTFSLYGVLRKKTGLSGTGGTAVESVLLIPLAATLLFSPQLAPVDVINLPAGSNVMTLLLLSLGGALTALPLVWFAEAAQRMPLSVLGFYQYISPTFQFLIAVFIFKESFDEKKLFAFLLIWSGLAIFVFDSLKRLRMVQPAG